MKQRMGRFAGLAGASALVVSCIGFGGGAASATPVGAVPFGQANFNGYATGDELHLGLTALNSLSGATGLNLNSLDQGLSSASTSTAGLTSNLNSELGTLIQPAQAAGVHAFNEGAGLQVDLGQIGSQVNSLLSQVKSLIPLPSISIAPPNSAAAIGQVGPINLDPLLDAAALTGEAQAAWPGESCPTGNLSYGLGNAAAVHALTALPAVSGLQGLTGAGLSGAGLTSAGVTTAPLLSTTGNGTAVSQSKSLTSLVPNGDGSYGVQTQASDIIAPISLNLLGLAQLDIAVHSAGGVNDPVTLTSTTSGENSVPASLKMSTDDIIDVTLTALGKTTTLVHVPLSTIGKGGLHIDLTASGILSGLSQIALPDTVSQTLNNIISALPTQLQQPVQQVVTALEPLLGQVTNVVSTVQGTVNSLIAQPTVQDLLNLIQGTLTLNLGHLDIDTFPHAIGGNWNDAPNIVGGTQASGALDLVNLKLGLTNSSINIGGQTIPAGLIPGVSQAITIPTIAHIPLPEIPLANPVIGHLETAATQQQPIACTVQATTSTPQPQAAAPTPTTVAPRLPFTGGPGGLWQPVTGVALLGLGGGALALVRRLRRNSAV